MFKKFCDEVIGLYALGLAFKIQDHPVPQRRARHEIHIFKRDVETSLQ